MSYRLTAVTNILCKICERMTNKKLFWYLTIYITTINNRVASRALQGVTKSLDAWAAERKLIFFPKKTVNIIFKKKVKNQ